MAADPQRGAQPDAAQPPAARRAGAAVPGGAGQRQGGARRDAGRGAGRRRAHRGRARCAGQAARSRGRTRRRGGGRAGRARRSGRGDPRAAPCLSQRRDRRAGRRQAGGAAPPHRRRGHAARGVVPAGRGGAALRRRRHGAAAGVMTATPRYDRVAQLLHWLIAALAVAAVTLGIVIGLLPRGGAARETVLLLHRSVGLTIFAAMVLRLLWRLGHKPPPLPPSLKPVEVVLAKSVHIVLYLLFFLLPVAQIAIALHLAGQCLIYLFVGLHSAAALLHALRRDGVMARMLPGLR